MAGLEQKYLNANMTDLAGIVKNDGTKPTPIQYGKGVSSFHTSYMLDPTSYKTPGHITYGYQLSGRAAGSKLDLQDSGPQNAPLNHHKQQYTPQSGETYTDAIPTLLQHRAIDALK